MRLCEQACQGISSNVSLCKIRKVYHEVILPSLARHARLEVWPWQQVNIWAVDSKRGDDNMNINYDPTSLLTALWKVTPRSPRLSCLMLIWLVREKGWCRGCIAYIRELKESASGIQLDSWKCYEVGIWWDGEPLAPIVPVSDRRSL